MLVPEDGKADPHKIAALPKMKMVVRFSIVSSCLLLIGMAASEARALGD